MSPAAPKRALAQLSCGVCAGHGHAHAQKQAAAAKQAAAPKQDARHASIYGIGSFIYSRRRPFHPVKLSAVIKQLPVSVNDALELNIAAPDSGSTPAPVDTAATQPAATGATGGPAAGGAGATTGEAGGPDAGLKRVIRSKGFTWLATYHTAALYWSHAGTHFELKNVGSWWAAVEPQNLPDGQVPAHVLKDFEGEFGDRRQEIIFIGMKLDQAKIVKALDDCLLTDAEFVQYRKHWQKVAAQAPASTAG